MQKDYSTVISSRTGLPVGDAALPAAVASDGPLTGQVLELLQSGRKSGSPLMDVAAVSPPPGNTGAQTPEEVSALIDWWSFTLPDGTDPSGVMEWLGGGFALVEGGFHGYRKVWRRGNVSVAAEGQLGMGVHVNVTGKGCRELEGLNVVQGASGWRLFAARVLDQGGHFSRIDAAVDERKGGLELEIIRAAAEQGDICTVYRGAVQKIWSHDPNSGQVVGRTVNFGSGKSDSKVRLYDKRLERIEKGEPDPGVWNRCEVQLRNERATRFARELVASPSFGALVAGLVRGLIDVKVRGSQLQRYKWDTHPMWAQFLSWAARVKLGREPAVRTVDKTLRWLETNVATAIGFVALAIPGDSWLSNLVGLGMEKVRRSPLYMHALGEVVVYDTA